MDIGSTAWVLICAALVLLMTPGLAFYYGGMVRPNNVLGIMMQSFVAIGIVTIVWTMLSFSLAFGEGNGFIGDLRFAGLRDLSASMPAAADLHVPLAAFAAFQLMFAIVTPALVTGATVERWRFGAFALFLVVWSVLVYAPIAHWVFAPTGWAARLGALDFAGGTVVHINAGAAALAMAIMLGRRRGWPDQHARPHNLPLVMLGTALLWFGWLGFNGGSALRADGVAAAALFNTQVAAATAMMTWMAMERFRFGKPTALGTASGAVAGLVAITPAAGYVAPPGALVIGLLAGAVCQLAVGLKTLFDVDDSLDVVAMHMGGGLIGSVCVGLFATRSVNEAGADGLFYGGGYRLLGVQVIVVLAAAAYSFVATLLIGGLTNRLVGNRVRPREELAGLDLTQHGESAYNFNAVTVGSTATTTNAASAAFDQPWRR